jgi:asparagine synthase (glutamine-hydrolysing)
MCGIFSILSSGPKPASQVAERLDSAADCLSHRGPDGRGIWVSDDGLVGLAHVRLSIIDLESGAQPMRSRCGRYTIVFNGEIYNYIELRNELDAATFTTTSDTEVILRAFERWGPACVERLRGMFAIAIWDAKDRSLFLARDRFGIKPLYWAQTPSGLCIASEMKAVAPLLAKRRVNSEALSDYFSFQWCLGEKTLLEGVHQFPAAHHAIVRPGESVRPERYWEVHYDIDFEHTEAWFVRRLRELLEDSVRVHLRADVEVGAYVSGGVDSSLMASLARQERPDGRMRGFNGRFIDGPDFDESSYARALGDERRIEMHVTDIGERDFVECIQKVIWHLDQPVAGPGAFPQYMVSRDVGRQVKVVLGGQGGDEIFGGYARYLVAYFEQCIKGGIEGTLRSGNYVVTYESIIQNLVTLKQYKPMLREFWAEGLFEERDRRYWRLVNRANTFGPMLARGTIDRERTFAEFKQIYWGENVGKESYFDSMTHFDFKTLLPALLQVEDRMSMAHGVESRVPLLDHPLVEFAATIPADVKFKNGELKRLLRVAFGDMLPPSIRDRKDKMGFPVPLNGWVRRGGPARELIGDLLGSKSAQSRPYLADGAPIDRLLDSQSTYGRNLWALLCLEIWHRTFVDS